MTSHDFTCDVSITVSVNTKAYSIVHGYFNTLGWVQTTKFYTMLYRQTCVFHCQSAPRYIVGLGHTILNGLPFKLLTYIAKKDLEEHYYPDKYRP